VGLVHLSRMAWFIRVISRVDCVKVRVPSLYKAVPLVYTAPLIMIVPHLNAINSQARLLVPK